MVNSAVRRSAALAVEGSELSVATCAYGASVGALRRCESDGGVAALRLKAEQEHLAAVVGGEPSLEVRHVQRARQDILVPPPDRARGAQRRVPVWRARAPPCLRHRLRPAELTPDPAVERLGGPHGGWISPEHVGKLRARAIGRLAQYGEDPGRGVRRRLLQRRTAVKQAVGLYTGLGQREVTGREEGPTRHTGVPGSWQTCLAAPPVA